MFSSPSYQVRFRRATQSDGDQLMDKKKIFWDASYNKILSKDDLHLQDDDQIKKEFQEAISSDCISVLLCEYQNEIIGYAIAGPLRPFDNIIHYNKKKYDGIQGEIWSIYVDFRFQQRGIGQVLFSKCRAWLRSHPLCPFLVWVFAENHPARKFYEKHGGVLIDLPEVVFCKKYPEAVYKFE